MKIGIGLPATIPHVQGSLILDWARTAEAGPFSSLAVIDRVVYENYEPLITLAAVAGATTRIRLITTVLITPTRDTRMLAKQSATIDAISNGRLTLGLGVGNREDDFRATSTAFHTRGKRFDQQLAQMSRIWSGQAASDDVGPIGPSPVQTGGPEILIGGYSAAAISRLSQWGNGFIAGGRAPRQTADFLRLADETWKNAGRPGKPRLVACTYFGLGSNASEGITKAITHYYSFLGEAAQQMAKNIPSTPDTLRSTIQAFNDLGVDELIAWPCIPELDQIQRLEDIIGAGEK